MYWDNSPISVEELESNAIVSDLSLGSLFKAGVVSIFFVGGTVGGTATFLVGGNAIINTGGGAITAGAKLLESLPRWLKWGGLAFGLGFAGDSTLQAVNNMNQCGMDVWNAFYHKNRNLGQSIATGLYSAGLPLLSILTGGASIAGNIIGAGIYGLAQATENFINNQSPLDDFSLFSLASNAFWGGVLNSANLEIAKVFEPIARFRDDWALYSLTGLLVTVIQNRVDNYVTGSANENPVGFVAASGGGLTNIVSRINPTAATIATLAWSIVVNELNDG